MLVFTHKLLIYANKGGQGRYKGCISESRCGRFYSFRFGPAFFL